MLLLKWAILREWICVFSPFANHNAFYWSCQAVIVVNIVFYLTIILLSNLACTPYKRNWDKTVQGKCWDIKIIGITTAVINFIIDVIILALPQKVIWGLQMSKRKKFGFSIIFAVGLMYVWEREAHIPTSSCEAQFNTY